MGWHCPVTPGPLGCSGVCRQGWGRPPMGGFPPREVSISWKTEAAQPTQPFSPDKLRRKKVMRDSHWEFMSLNLNIGRHGCGDHNMKSPSEVWSMIWRDPWGLNHTRHNKAFCYPISLSKYNHFTKSGLSDMWWAWEILSISSTPYSLTISLKVQRLILKLLSCTWQQLRSVLRSYSWEDRCVSLLTMSAAWWKIWSTFHWKMLQIFLSAFHREFTGSQ